MSTNSEIEWTDATWNPLLGCERVGPGCDRCYAIRQGWMRAANPHPKISEAFYGLVKKTDQGLDWTGQINLLPDRLRQPFRWTKPRRIFVNSLSDLFHADVPTEYIAKVFAVMVAAPRHTFQVLTKRHGRMRSLLNSEGFWQEVAAELGKLWQERPHPPLTSVPPWIWIGVSVENQRYADMRIPALLDTPAAVRWISAEPLLGPIDLHPHWLAGKPSWGPPEFEPTSPAGIIVQPLVTGPRLAWVVVGGESGPGARPMHPDWARSLRDQCVNAGVPFMFKQHGDFLSVPVVDDPRFSGGRAFNSPQGGRYAASLQERGSGPFRAGVIRPMRAGDRNGHGQMLDDNTIAVRVGKKRAGRELDGRLWDEYPDVAQ